MRSAKIKNSLIRASSAALLLTKYINVI
jgi:hypothetical protein